MLLIALLLGCCLGNVYIYISPWGWSCIMVWKTATSQGEIPMLNVIHSKCVTWLKSSSPLVLIYVRPSSGICMVTRSAQSQLRHSLDWMFCVNCESMCLGICPVAVLVIQVSSSPPGFSIATGFLRSETTHLCSHLCWNGCKNIKFCGNNFFYKGTKSLLHEIFKFTAMEELTV